jgi:hypothetical protein
MHNLVRGSMLLAALGLLSGCVAVCLATPRRFGRGLLAIRVTTWGLPQPKSLTPRSLRGVIRSRPLCD